MKLTLGTELSPIGKDKLGQVAYETAGSFHPEARFVPWEEVDPEYKEMYIAIAVSVRGFHPDA